MKLLAASLVIIALFNDDSLNLLKKRKVSKKAKALKKGKPILNI